jgi:hypothetical protein
MAGALYQCHYAKRIQEGHWLECGSKRIMVSSFLLVIREGSVSIKESLFLSLGIYQYFSYVLPTPYRILVMSMYMFDYMSLSSRNHTGILPHNKKNNLYLVDEFVCFVFLIIRQKVAHAKRHIYDNLSQMPPWRSSLNSRVRLFP